MYFCHIDIKSGSHFVVYHNIWNIDEGIKVSFLSISEWKYLKFCHTCQLLKLMAGFFSSFKKNYQVHTSRLQIKQI